MNDENKMKISYSEKLSNQNRKCNSGKMNAEKRSKWHVRKLAFGVISRLGIS